MLFCTRSGRFPQEGAVLHTSVLQINDHGNVLMDEHVRPKARVTDFRTQFSGVVLHVNHRRNVLMHKRAETRC